MCDCKNGPRDGEKNPTMKYQQIWCRYLYLNENMIILFHECIFKDIMGYKRKTSENDKKALVGQYQRS